MDERLIDKKILFLISFVELFLIINLIIKTHPLKLHLPQDFHHLNIRVLVSLINSIKSSIYILP